MHLVRVRVRIRLRLRVRVEVRLTALTQLYAYRRPLVATVLELG